jgi:hypothetical protein
MKTNTTRVMTVEYMQKELKHLTTQVLKKRVAVHNNGMILLCAYYSPCSSRTTEVKNAQ